MAKTKSSQDSYKSNQKIGLWITIIIIIVIIVGLLCWSLKSASQQYGHYVTSSDPQVVINKQNKYRRSNKLEYDFTYRAGCANCDSIESKVTPMLKHQRKTDGHLIVVNANEDAMHRYLLRLGIIKEPTLAVRYRGFLLYQYTGTNVPVIKSLMHGKNPKTNKPLKHGVPRRAVIEDEYMHSIGTKPSDNDAAQIN